MNVAEINKLIQELPSEERGKVSDGFHSFSELYDHRVELWITLLDHLSNTMDSMQCDWIYKDDIWRTKLHSDGSSFEGWFVLGFGKKSGKQITYHLPISKWEDCTFANTLEKAPTFDGHSSSDVLNRLKSL